jgi:hypothetical protein
MAYKFSIFSLWLSFKKMIEKVRKTRKHLNFQQKNELLSDSKLAQKHVTLQESSTLRLVHFQR